ncbi:MAG: sigma-54 dependent transcriptional regulator, partial [Candidatus Poribacteria bacterium]|nr:sigma-54 dependent transcriptional regulator [Candidatus Poribacteria bacterium]
PTPLTDPNAFPIIGESEQMREVWRQVAQVAPTNATVLITGETGVGKEVVAQTIHENSSRKNRLFKAVNCGVLYQDLLQSELFGHEKGAFTGATSQRRGVFELADGGTLFLDEIGEMSAEVQVKFLRVLETQEFTRLGGEKNVKVDVRVIAATNVDLETSVKKKDFRQDLYYRLNLFRIQIPPLRDRREDIPLFVDAFISELSTKHNKSIVGIKSEALNYLENADWHGNIRQLKNAVETAIIVATSEELELKDFPTDSEFGHPKFPVQIIDEPGTSIQVVNPEPGTIATENVTIYKTILGLILSAVRLLEPTAAYNDKIPSLIPDDDTSWLQITDTEDPAAVLRKTLEVLSTIAKALEQRTDEGLIPLPIIPNNEHAKVIHGTNQDEEDAIGKVGMTMTQIEKEAIQKTLAETGGNKTEAAKILDIGVRTLHRKLDAYKQETDKTHDTQIQE